MVKVNFNIMSGRGDTNLAYNLDLIDDVKAAEDKFNELVGDGGMNAMALVPVTEGEHKGGNRIYPLQRFDPNVGDILFKPRLAGG